MFNVGELIIYSAHGICRIDDICEKTFCGVTKSYYVIHPIADSKLTINTPVDNRNVTMLELIDKEEAKEIIKSFKQPGADWIETNTQRQQVYSEVIKTGNRREISKILNTLMRKKQNIEMNGKKMHEKDNNLLTTIQDILFKELAISLNTTAEAVYEKCVGYMDVNEYQS